MTLLSYSFLFFTIIVSGASVFLFKKINAKQLKLLLAFSGAYLFALTVLHLIPEVYSTHDKWIGMYIFIGFFLQIVLEIFSEGIEHGHIHVHKHHTASFPYAMMIGLCVHSFLEGMPLEKQFSNESVQHSLLTGIILHHIPVALALMSMMLQSGLKRKFAILLLIIFASMAPMGAFTSFIMSEASTGNLFSYFDKVMAIVIGIFLHISTTILFETYEEHRFNYYKLLIILMGAGLAVVSL